jgi:hypothetical protein
VSSCGLVAVFVIINTVTYIDLVIIYFRGKIRKMNLKSEINNRMNTFLEPFKNDKPTVLYFKNKTEQTAYFEKEYKSLTFESPYIEILPPEKLRNQTIGFKVICDKNEQLFFYYFLEGFNGKYTLCMECMLISESYKKRVYLGKRNVNFSFEALEVFLNELYIFFKNYVLENKKKQKIISIRTNVLQQQIKTKISELNLNSSFEQEENKLVLNVPISRKRSIRYPFYYSKFEKDIKRIDLILNDVLELKKAIENYPTYITIK